MSINLIEIAKEYLSDAVVGKIASSIGLDPDSAQSIIGKVFPSLVGAFGEKAATGEGATQLFDTLKDEDGGMLDNLGDFFTGDNSGIIGQGTELLTSLFGGKLSSLTDVLGSMIPGLSGGKASGLLGLLAPVVTGMLGKQVKSSGLDASGLTSLLGDQKEHIESAVGGDLLGKFGFASFGGKVADLASDATDALGDTVSGATDKVGGVIAGAAGAVGGAVSGTADKLEGAMSGAAGAVGGAIAGTADKLGSAASGAADVVGDKVSGAADKVGDVAGSAVGAAKSLGESAVDAATDTTKKAGNGLMKLIPLLLLGLLAFLGFKMCSSSKDGDGKTGASDRDGKSPEAVAGTVGGDTVSGDSGNAGTDHGDGSLASMSGGDSGSGEAGSSGAGDSGMLGDGLTTQVMPSFVPVAEEGGAVVELSEKALNLARALNGVKVDEGVDVDSFYASIGEQNGAKFLYRIPFLTGETGVPSSQQAALIAKLKEADEGATIVTIGYADVRGDDVENRKLSYGRAKEVGAWIKGTLGSDVGVESFSMGETDRFSKSDFSRNRVVEVWQMK